jgi:GTP-binding protein
MDARHPLTPLDEQLLGWLSGARVLILLSKCDKLARREEASAIEQVRAAVATRAGQTEVRLFSAVTRQGVEECRALLAEWLRDARASRGNKKPPVKGM